MAWVLAVLVTLGTARAAPPYLETAPVATEASAQAIAVRAADSGCPGAVVRRYVKGQGWAWVFRTDAPGDAVPEGCTRAGALGDGVVLAAPEATRVAPTATKGRAPRPATPAAPEPTGFVSPWTVDEVLSRLVRAHDGSSGGPDAADTLLFRFVRTLPDGARVEHTYARRAEDLYLQVDVPQGHGVSSRSGVVGGRAWLAGSTTTFPVDQARAQVERFSPRAVLQLAGMLASGTLDLPERAELRVLAVHRAGGDEWVEVGTEGDRAAPPLTLLVDSRTWRLRAVVRGPEGVQVRWDYTGWRETEDGALRPERIEVTRAGALLDRVDVSELELSPTLPEEWFPVPAAP